MLEPLAKLELVKTIFLCDTHRKWIIVSQSKHTFRHCDEVLHSGIFHTNYMSVNSNCIRKYPEKFL
jgi:hypothetical protein